MIMRQPAFRYNSKNIKLINMLRTFKPRLTPVESQRGSCHRSVGIFIHSVIHSFPMLSRQGSQQVQIVLADPPLSLP